MPARAFIILLGRCCTLVIVLLVAPWAAAATPAAGHDVLEVFVRDGCPHCADAKEFLPTFSSTRPWLRISYRSLDHDATAREPAADTSAPDVNDYDTTMIENTMKSLAPCVRAFSAGA